MYNKRATFKTFKVIISAAKFCNVNVLAECFFFTYIQKIEKLKIVLMQSKT